MKQYIGTKIIQAEPAMDKEVLGGVDRPDMLGLEQKPLSPRPGYRIVYPDGYESWSPKEAFEEAYRLTSGLTFGFAIEAMKHGHKVARAGWNGKGMFIVLMPALYLPPYNTADTSRKVNERTAKWIGEDAPLDSQPYIAMFTAQKKWQPGWLASQADMLAEDWFIVE